MQIPPTIPASGSEQAPHPGSHVMPRWDLGELPPPPRFTAKSWALLIGPGLVTGGAAIGGGEWLLGPLVAARYGGALLWLTTLSILGQVIYNLEISRYTLYTGEPIFVGKFRVPPGPRVWIWTYLVLDFGSIFPYLAANAATPLAAAFLGRIPFEDGTFSFAGHAWSDRSFVQALRYVCFLAALVPLTVGGKVYRSLKVVMAVKIVVVFGFLGFLAFFYSSAGTWREIGTGFIAFGTVPAERGEGGVDNLFAAWWAGRPMPAIDLTMIGFLAALAAVAGNGGLTSASVSAYTRDQGWGMGSLVGAVPSLVGGRHLKLSHVGMVFPVTPESVARFRGWFRHVLRDQLVVWMPACFIGVALPSMLSIQFLPRGTQASDWSMAAMTADAVAGAIGGRTGAFCWFMTLFCGFLVLAPSGAAAADGFLRRWVDVFWTGSVRLRKLEPERIRQVYFGVLCAYTVFGLIALSLAPPRHLILWATVLYNYVLGVSCWHTVAVNAILLPPELRPGWAVRIALVLTGMFFTALAVITTINTLGLM